MPIPFLIPIAVAAAGAAGISAVSNAKEKSEKAESLVKEKEALQKSALKELQSEHEKCSLVVDNLDNLKREVLATDIARFLRLYKKIGELKITLPPLDTSFDYSGSNDEISAIDVSFQPTLNIAITTVASAALLGGGFIAVPAFIWSAISASNKADEALTEAEKYAAQVDIRCEEMKNDKLLLQAVSVRCIEFESVIGELRKRLKVSLDALDKTLESYNGSELNESSIQNVHKSFSLAKSLKDVVSINILDSNGELTCESEEAANYLPST